jgi:hypothetical protein
MGRLAQKRPSDQSLSRVRKLVEVYCRKTGTTTHPEKEVTELVVLGLAGHIDELGKPLCPCRFYPDKKEEARHRTWARGLFLPVGSWLPIPYVDSTRPRASSATRS